MKIILNRAARFYFFINFKNVDAKTNFIQK